MILLIATTLLAAQAGPPQPDWVASYGESKRYPREEYLTGFGMAMVSGDTDEADAARSALADARRVLIENVRVRIRSELVLISKEQGHEFSESATSTIHSSASMELEGLAHESWHDGTTSAAFAWVHRGTLATGYERRLAELRTDIAARHESAREAESNGERGLALERYLGIDPLLAQLGETETLLAVVAPRAQVEAFLARSRSETAQAETITPGQLRRTIEGLVSKPIGSLDDLAGYVSHCLGVQVPEGGQIQVSSFTFQETGMSSPFGRYVQRVVEGRLGSRDDWSVVEQVATQRSDLGSGLFELAAAVGARYVLTGTYWEQSSGAKLMLRLRNTANGVVHASVDALVPSRVVETAGFDLKPQNFIEAASTQRIFRQDEVLGAGLTLDIWTDSGAENVVLAGGDELRLYVRVNMPCYLRVIYHLADGTRVLLVDNHYLDATKVNKVYTLPDTFECAAPFGVEFLQANAQTRAFEHLVTESSDGYDLIIESLRSIVGKTRGLKRKREVRDLRAETRVIVTTFED